MRWLVQYVDLQHKSKFLLQLREVYASATDVVVAQCSLIPRLSLLWEELGNV